MNATFHSKIGTATKTLESTEQQKVNFQYSALIVLAKFFFLGSLVLAIGKG